jgi:hypothetical protein
MSWIQVPSGWVEVSDAGHVQGGRVIDPDRGQRVLSDADLNEWEIVAAPVPGIEAAR